MGNAGSTSDTADTIDKADTIANAEGLKTMADDEPRGAVLKPKKRKPPTRMLPPKPKPPAGTRRRPKGEGTVFLRTRDGRWCGVITIRDREGERPKRHTVYGRSEIEVRDKLLELRTHLKAGTYVAPSGLTAEGWLRRWIDETVAPRRKPATVRSYNSVIANHVAGTAFAKLRVEKVRPSDVHTLLANMRSDKVGARTRQLLHSVLHASFTSAVALEISARNPVTRVARPQLPRREMQALNPEQVTALLDAAHGDRLRPLYVLALGSGLREGELLALHWSELDLRARRVTVERTLDPRTLRREAVKTDRSRRQVDIPESVARELREHQRRTLAEGRRASPWVFCDRDGGPLRASNFTRRSWKPLLRRAGLPSIRFHDLRHSFASLSLAAGVPLHVVSRCLGHAGPNITASVYAHVLPGQGADAAAAMERYLRPGGG